MQNESHDQGAVLRGAGIGGAGSVQAAGKTDEKMSKIRKMAGLGNSNTAVTLRTTAPCQTIWLSSAGKPGGILSAFVDKLFLFVFVQVCCMLFFSSLNIEFFFFYICNSNSYSVSLIQYISCEFFPSYFSKKQFLLYII